MREILFRGKRKINTVGGQAINRLICLLLAVIILLGTMSACAAEPEPEPTEPLTYTIVEVVDSHYIPPNTYEICYRTTFSNGLIIDFWKTVDREEYEREVESNIEK